jgi:hypothetical protein
LALSRERAHTFPSIQSRIPSRQNHRALGSRNFGCAAGAPVTHQDQGAPPQLAREIGVSVGWVSKLIQRAEQEELERERRLKGPDQNLYRAST